MPSHKMLKGVAGSIVESFTSLMNYIENDYIMGHIISTAWQTNGTKIQANLLIGKIEDSPLAIVPVRQSIALYAQDFPDLIKRSKSSMEFVKSAELIITVDPTIKRNVSANYFESPYTCTVNIIDERDKLYTYSKRGWWYPE